MKTSIFLLAALLGTSIVHAQHSSKKSYSRSENQSSNDQTSINIDREGVRYEIELVNDKLTALSVDGKVIPAAEWGKYDATIKEIMIQVKKDRAQAELDRIQADKDRIEADKDRARADKDREQARGDKVQADKDREQATKDRAKAELDRQQAMKDREQAEKDREQAGLDRIQADKDRAQADEDRKQMKAMISELVSDKIIPNEASLESVRISGDEMTVNGKKQDDEVYKKYKTKYSRFANGNFMYNRSGGKVYMGN